MDSNTTNATGNWNYYSTHEHQHPHQQQHVHCLHACWCNTVVCCSCKSEWLAKVNWSYTTISTYPSTTSSSAASCHDQIFCG